MRPGPDVWFGSSRRAFGSPGAGGSFAFADPDAHVGYAYVMNKMDFYLTDDPREKPLREALYRAIARLADRERAVNAAAPAKMMPASRHERSEKIGLSPLEAT
jgi:CubicO group peptidase (beta-lactamase class C family)